MTVPARGVVAVDVGGTGIKGAIVGLEDGRWLHEATLDTPVAEGPSAIVAALCAFIDGLLRAAEGAGHAGGSSAGSAPAAVEVVGIGVVVPGSVDAAAGMARFSANLGWRELPLRALVQQHTGVATVLEHDVRAAGIVEQTIGRTRGVADSLVVVIGTGIAGVVTIATQPVAGATGVAGELGHLPIWPDGELCPCGQRGCLERYASAAAISRRYHAACGRSATPGEIAALRDVDPAAARVWDEAIQALAIGLASCTMLVDPALIVVSGGLSQAGAALLDPLQVAFARRVVWREPPTVELSPLGARGGLWGAAIVAARAADVQDVQGWG